LSIGVGDDGAVLLHCFAGCDVDAVVRALGLSVDDLFPPRNERPGGGASPLKRRRPITASQAIDLLHDEALVVWVVASDMAIGKTVSEADHARLTQAVARIDRLRAEVYS